MATTSYLPPALSEATVQELLESLSLPRAKTVEPLKVSAAFHSIYVLGFGPEDASRLYPATPGPDGSVDLVLRVAGRHFQGIKTRNEVGSMEWVRRHTSIPIPAVIKFDDKEDNVVAHEYTLLERVPGVSVDTIYDRLGEKDKKYLVEQLTDYLIELHSQPWKVGFVGGLVPAGTGKNNEGPPLEETFWPLPDVEKYWLDPAVRENPMCLNPLNPVRCWTSYASQCLDRYVFAIQRHPSLAWMRDIVPRIQALATVITTTYQKELDDTEYVLAHKDLHFANIMCDPSTLRITSILDWEFAGVVPAPRWNPVRAFLWNTQQTPESKPEKDSLYPVFHDCCRARGAEWLLRQVGMTPKQEAMSAAVNYIRAIVEVCPRNQSMGNIHKWRKTVEESMEIFGV